MTCQTLVHNKVTFSNKNDAPHQENLFTSKGWFYGLEASSQPICQHGVDQLHMPVRVCCAPLAFVLFSYRQ